MTADLSLAEVSPAGPVTNLRQATVSAEICGAWKLSQTEIAVIPILTPWRVFLGDIYINTQLSRLSDVKEIGFHSSRCQN